MKTCYYCLVLRPLWGQEGTFLFEAKRVCWQDEKEGKANLFCSVFIDSFFTDVVPVINNHSIQFFCSSLCVPKEFARSLCRGINTQLENFACFSIFIRADAKTAEATDGGAWASRSDGDLLSKTIQPLAIYKATNHIKHNSARHTREHKLLSLSAKTSTPKLAWTLTKAVATTVCSHIHVYANISFFKKDCFAY